MYSGERVGERGKKHSFANPAPCNGTLPTPLPPPLPGAPGRGSEHLKSRAVHRVAKSLVVQISGAAYELVLARSASHDLADLTRRWFAILAAPVIAPPNARSIARGDRAAVPE